MDASSGWAVGYGPLALHTADGGKTWQTQRTGVRNPLNGVDFVDGKHGWAVGEGGVIVATADAGKTWTTQRAGLTQVKLMVAHAHHDDELYQNGPLIARYADLGYPVALYLRDRGRHSRTRFQRRSHLGRNSAMSRMSSG